MYTFIQGMMFGYATDETPDRMPLTLVFAHRLNKDLADGRRSGSLPWVLPDSKSQVSIILKTISVEEKHRESMQLAYNKRGFQY